LLLPRDDTTIDTLVRQRGSRSKNNVDKKVILKLILLMGL